MPLFVISSEYLAKPLMNFWHTSHFCRNLPFSPKLAILLLWSPFVKIPLFVTSIEVLPNLWWILSQFPVFLNLPFSRRSPTVNMPLLLARLNFLLDLYMQFHKICHFHKTHNYRHASFVILLTFLPNVYEFLSSFPSLSPHLSFCQTFDGFLPNHPFSQFANFVKSLTVNIAGLHLRSRRPCWWLGTKAFLSSGNQTLFAC